MRPFSWKRRSNSNYNFEIVRRLRELSCLWRWILRLVLLLNKLMKTNLYNRSSHLRLSIWLIRCYLLRAYSAHISRHLLLILNLMLNSSGTFTPLLQHLINELLLSRWVTVCVLTVNITSSIVVGLVVSHLLGDRLSLFLLLEHVVLLKLCLGNELLIFELFTHFIV